MASQPLNLNTASIEELRTLEGIGRLRANAIVNFRESVGYPLREEDIEQIPGIPAAVWNKLLEQGEICFDQPNPTTMSSPEDRSVKHTMEKMAMQMEQLCRMFALSQSAVNQSSNNNSPDARPRQRVLPGGISHDFFDERAPRGIYNMTNDEGYHRRPEINGPMAKMMTFDGKSDWRSFRLQFEELATTYHWNNDIKLRKFVECLRDRALSFYSGQQERIRRHYQNLVDRMERHFGRREPPATIRRRLHNMKQALDEPLEDFAEKIHTMAQEGYTGAPEDIVEIVAVEAFLKGCTDKSAALFAMNQNPESIYTALDMVTTAIHNQRLLGTKHGNDLRRVSFEEEQMDEIPRVRQIQNVKNSEMDNLKSEVAMLKQGMMENTKNITEILHLLKTSKQNRGRSPSPASRTFRCFKCNEAGHLMKDCPNSKQDHSPSTPIKSNDTLNY